MSTRAIYVDASPADVWPWLAQMGPSPRGGAYTYDFIENLLGLNMHSVDRVLPEFQDPQVGDSIALGSNRMELALVESGRALGLALRGRELGLGVHPGGSTRSDPGLSAEIAFASPQVDTDAWPCCRSSRLHW